MRKKLLGALLVGLGTVGVVVASLSVGGSGRSVVAAAASESAVGTPDQPRFDSAFDAYWGDGKAELAGYDITQPRYGQLRKGVAVTITVTEPFSNSVRVKADDGKHPAKDVFPVIKLNLVEDFQTGVYDYNLMTSVFIAMKPLNGRETGHAAKVSFSAQEWCGHAYAQILPDESSVRFTSHSYFDGEADENSKLDLPAGGISEDTLILWSRGLAAPFIKPGETRTAPMLRSLKSARLNHRPMAWASATLERKAEPVSLDTATGPVTAEVRVVTAAAPLDRTWTFYVEAAHPHRLLKWTVSDGTVATLIKAERQPYWSQHGDGDEKFLESIGLTRRAPRQP